MPLEPTKHVNGRMWPADVSGNPNGRPVGSRTAFSHGFLKDLAEVWQEHGRDTMLHTAKTQPAMFFEAPNECAIYLLRSSLRQTSCWVSAITGGTGPKITEPTQFWGGKQGPQFLWDSGTWGPTFCRGGREGSLFISLAARGTGLLIRRQVLQRKKGPIEHSSRFS